MSSTWLNDIEHRKTRVGSPRTSGFVERFNGTVLHDEGTLRNGVSRHARVDVVAAYNAANAIPLDPDAGWTPTLYRRIDPTQAVPVQVILGAGPFK